jgi:hypothetical protein
MRRLFGVVMLAAVPIACGTAVPTLPTASLPEEASSAQDFAASARVAPLCSEKVDWSVVTGVVISEARRGRGSVTVRADLLIRGGVGVPLPCHTKTFSVTPSGRGIVLQRENDREATLRAPAGAYEVSVLVEGSAKPAYTATMKLAIPGR